MPNPIVGLRIDPDLVLAMKIRALQEKRSLQEITEELWRAYLGIEGRDEATDRRGSGKRSAVLAKDALSDAKPGRRPEVDADRAATEERSATTEHWLEEYVEAQAGGKNEPLQTRKRLVDEIHDRRQAPVAFDSHDKQKRGS